MATKILVPTDLSANSKAGIRFAIQLARQNESKLIFYHAAEILRPTRWNDRQFAAYKESQLVKETERLVRFVGEVYESMRIRKRSFDCVVEHTTRVRQSIIKYAEKAGAKYICMSTRGAGRLKKLIGTNASEILTTSPVPVFVIPNSYRIVPIKSIAYSTDLRSLGRELRIVKDVAKGLKAKITVYHYDYLMHLPETKNKLAASMKKYKTPGVTFKFQKLNLEKPLSDHLMKDVKKDKSSLVVLFTDQRRGWFDKIFLSSKSAEIAFSTKVPLLIFPKQ